MGKMREELIMKMNQNNWNIRELAIMCDTSYHTMCNIVNGVSNDMKFSTFLKICKNASISYAKVFEINNDATLEIALRKLVISCGGRQYKLKKC